MMFELDCLLCLSKKKKKTENGCVDGEKQI